MRAHSAIIILSSYHTLYICYQQLKINQLIDYSTDITIHRFLEKRMEKKSY